MQVNSNQFSFGRKLRGAEQKDAQIVLQKALNHLDKEFGIIMPDSMAPSYDDTGMNTFSNPDSQKMLLSFLMQNGIKLNTIQDLPAGLKKKTDNSPYASNSLLTDIFRINLKSLTTKEYGEILSQKTYKEILKENKNNNAYYNNSPVAVKTREKVQKEIYQTYLSKLKNFDTLSPKEKTVIKGLSKDFEKIKKEKSKMLEKFALYDVLTKIHENDYYPNWGNETDKNLFDNDYDIEKRTSRIDELRKTYKKDIDAFIFTQMLAEKFVKKQVKNLRKNEIKMYSDTPIGFSDSEQWANPNLFLKHQRLDAKDSKVYNWGFRCLDYKKFFNKDGSLGESGKLLFEKYKTNFERYGFGGRIDHAMGLINPWICDEKDANIGSRAYEEYFKENQHKIITSIILPAANAAGIDTKNIIAEDNGFSDKERSILNKLNCMGMTMTRYIPRYELKNVSPDTVAFIGNHDDTTLIDQEIEKLPKNQKNDWELIKHNIKERFIDLFTCSSKKTQIFLGDLLGFRARYMDDDLKYKWFLRTTPDTFDKHYQEAIQDNMGFNMPEILLEACKRKTPDFEQTNSTLANKLKIYSQILKEKE